VAIVDNDDGCENDRIARITNRVEKRLAVQSSTNACRSNAGEVRKAIPSIKNDSRMHESIKMISNTSCVVNSIYLRLVESRRRCVIRAIFRLTISGSVRPGMDHSNPM